MLLLLKPQYLIIYNTSVLIHNHKWLKFYNFFCRYLAPEYLMHGIVDEKIDVFAFGVLLLELISGRRALDYSQQSLVLWVRMLQK